jgi:anti-sigma regulatory factor (Ser/Thr protein kinase)
MSRKYTNSFAVEGGNFDKAGIASVEIKKTLKNMGINGDTLRRVAIATYESEINIISYAKRGVINIEVTPDFVLLDVEDDGPGIENIGMAIKEGFSTANNTIREMGFGAGMGIPNIKNCSDAFELTSEVNKGTHLKVLIDLTGN